MIIRRAIITVAAVAHGFVAAPRSCAPLPRSLARQRAVVVADARARRDVDVAHAHAPERDDLLVGLVGLRTAEVGLCRVADPQQLSVPRKEPRAKR